MVLVRLAYAADLPTPDEALKALRDGAPVRGEPASAAAPSGNGGATRMAASGGAMAQAPMPRPLPRPEPASLSSTPPAPVVRYERFDDVLAAAAAHRELKLKHALEHNVSVNHFEDGRIEIALTPDAPAGFVGDLSRNLGEWTGRRWMVSVAREAARPTVAEVRRSAQARLVDDARADPVVAAVMARFPGAEIVDVRVRGAEPAPDEPPPVEDMSAYDVGDVPPPPADED
jgi:DNA polymerase-3 subunit gamma/tau